jgi:phytanoyl-CoA hydroxylase
MNTIKKKFFNNGYVLIKNFFDIKTLTKVKKDAENVFLHQFRNHLSNKIKKFDEKYMFDLFNKNFEAFSNCGKHIQHGSFELHKLAIHKKTTNLLYNIGISEPSLATRPVLFFNHRNLAKESVYYKTPPHQDWNSIKGSLDCIVMWIPLVDVPTELGPLKIVPKSHLNFSLQSGVIGGFGTVNKYKEKDYIDIPMNKGDVLLFSSFLVHQSGDILSNKIRWSCNFRYNNLQDEDFIKRNYEFSYIYKPKIKE